MWILWFPRFFFNLCGVLLTSPPKLARTFSRAFSERFIDFCSMYRICPLYMDTCEYKHIFLCPIYLEAFPCSCTYDYPKVLVMLCRIYIFTRNLLKTSKGKIHSALWIILQHIIPSRYSLGLSISVILSSLSSLWWCLCRLCECRLPPPGIWTPTYTVWARCPVMK